MKLFARLLPALACALALGHATAHAATVAQLACSDNIKANLSFYSLGFGNDAATSQEGAGAGKVTVKPLHIHTSVVNFVPFFQLVTNGKTLATCKLTLKSSDNNTIVYTFSNLLVTSVTAAGKSAASGNQQSVSYLDVQLIYEKIDVEANGEDDGGIDQDPTSGGWDVTKSTPV